MPVDPRIAAILADRAALKDAVKAELTRAAPRVTVQSIPAAPASTSTATAGVIIPAPAPAAPVATTQTATPEQLEQAGVKLVNRMAPVFVLIVDLMQGGFTLAKASRAAGLLIDALSLAVRDELPMFKGQEARTVVIVAFSVMFDQVLADLIKKYMPSWLAPFSGLLLPGIKAAAIKGLQAAYDAVISKNGK